MLTFEKFRIEEGIAKILCLQEYYRRRNEDTKSKRASQNRKGKGPVGDDGNNEECKNLSDDTSNDEMGKTDNDDENDDDEKLTPPKRRDEKSESTIRGTASPRKAGSRHTTNR